MSRTFTKEIDGMLDALPDLPISSLPKHVTRPVFSDWQTDLWPAIVKYPANQPFIEMDFRLPVTEVDQYDRILCSQIVDQTADDAWR